MTTIAYPDFANLPFIDTDGVLWNQFEEFVEDGTYVKEDKRQELLDWIMKNFPLVVLRDKSYFNGYWEYFGLGRCKGFEDSCGKEIGDGFLWVTLSHASCGEACLSAAWEDEIKHNLNSHSLLCVDIIKKP